MAQASTLTVDTDKVVSIGHREMPRNILAEQALLGAILINNEALSYLVDNFNAEHFYEPVHQRIYEAIRLLYDRAQIADPVTLKSYFDRDEALSAIGGAEYLARLAGAAVGIINVRDYSEMVYDLALKRRLIGIGEELVNTAYDNAVDQAAMHQIEAAEQQLFHLAAEGIGESGFQSIRVSVIETIRRAEAAYKNKGQIVGVTTGLVDLDRLLGGMHDSDLLILAGRPSMGKTALATTIAYNASHFFVRELEERKKKDPEAKGKSVGFFSLEMSGEQLASRILSFATAVNSSKLRRGDLTADEFAKIARESGRISTLPFHIDDTPALSIASLRTRARRLKRVHNLGLIVVDYLQLVRASHVNSQTNRVQEVSEITQGLKAIAKELNVPVMALSQLSRAVEQREDKRPQLSDLRESGSIEQDADVVMFVFREEYYLLRKQPREGTPEHLEWQTEMDKVMGIADVIIAKQRNGPVGNVSLQFKSELTRFEDLADSHYLPERHD